MKKLKEFRITACDIEECLKESIDKPIKEEHLKSKSKNKI